MNKRNDWQNLLKYANEDLVKYGYSLALKETDGCYDCQIVKDGVVIDTYAENYYEDELSDLINDAWHEVKTNTKYANTEYKHTYEVCPHCEEEVELRADLSVQTCPHCGRRIVACSMCRACDEDVNYCTNCCLCRQAELENEELGYTPKPLEEDEEEETFLGGKKWDELSEHDKGVVADLEC